MRWVFAIYLGLCFGILAYVMISGWCAALKHAWKHTKW